MNDAMVDIERVDIKLNARAARIKVATAALYGDWGCQTKMAASVGISKQMLSFIIHGDRPVTDKVEKAVADALARQANRLHRTARRWDAIAVRMQGRSRRELAYDGASELRAMLPRNDGLGVNTSLGGSVF